MVNNYFDINFIIIEWKVKISDQISQNYDKKHDYDKLKLLDKKNMRQKVEIIR